MGRRATPKKGKAKAKRASAHTPPKGDGGKGRDLEKRLTEALRREAEALDQQTATSEILRVISSSPTATQPVFDIVADRAKRLCDADQALVATFDGELVHLAALANFNAQGVEAMRRMYPRRHRLPTESPGRRAGAGTAGS